MTTAGVAGLVLRRVCYGQSNTIGCVDQPYFRLQLPVLHPGMSCPSTAVRHPTVDQPIASPEARAILLGKRYFAVSRM